MKLFIATLLLVPTLAFTEPTNSTKAVVCEEPDLITAALAKEYGEQVAIIGQGDQNQGEVNMLIIFVNKETKTYSAFESHNGKLCGLSMGENFTINWKAMPEK